jgi:hypothetical protein
MEEINILYDEIEKCNNWTTKLDLISQLKVKINDEEEIINNKISSVDNLIKISKKKCNVDLLLEEYNSTKDLDKKIQIYQTINSYINKISNDLIHN